MNPPDPLPPLSPDDDNPALNVALGWDEPSGVIEDDRLEAARFEECVAAAVLTAPRHRAPSRCLSAIHSLTAPRSLNGQITAINGSHVPASSNPSGPALSAVRKSTGAPPQKRLIAVTGWGLAAALAVLAGWQTVKVVNLHNEITNIKAGGKKHRPDGKGQSETANNDADERGPAGHSSDWNSKDPSSPVHGRNLKSRSRSLPYASVVVPDRPALMRQLEELQRLEKSRFESAPGLARTVVMELRQPGTKPGTPARTVMLSEEVAGLIAAGMDEKSRTSDSTPSADKPPVQFSGTDKDRPADDLVIKEGLPNFTGFTLQEGVTLFHENFPAEGWQEWTGLHLLKDGSFYDDINDILWKPLPGEGRRYAGSKPQDPIILDEQAVPPGTPAPDQPPATAPDVKVEPDQGPLIWSIYDESRGEGRFVVSGLPPAPEGQAYQVWFEDARSAAPITAGLLPALDQGAGQVGFSLTPGISPVRYRITLEPAAGSAQPRGPVVLTGP